MRSRRCCQRRLNKEGLAINKCVGLWVYVGEERLSNARAVFTLVKDLDTFICRWRFIPNSFKYDFCLCLSPHLFIMSGANVLVHVDLAVKSRFK